MSAQRSIFYHRVWNIKFVFINTVIIIIILHTVNFYYAIQTLWVCPPADSSIVQCPCSSTFPHSSSNLGSIIVFLRLVPNTYLIGIYPFTISLLQQNYSLSQLAPIGYQPSKALIRPDTLTCTSLCSHILAIMTGPRKFVDLMFKTTGKFANWELAKEIRVGRERLDLPI